MTNFKRSYLTKVGLLIIVSFTQCKENTGNKEGNINEQAITYVDEKKISIIKLIANPTLYDKRTVQIKGFVNIEFENNAIFLNKEDCENGIDKNGIWIQISKDNINKLSNFNKKYVRLEGIFDMTNNGHDGNFSGAITKIVKMENIK